MGGNFHQYTILTHPNKRKGNSYETRFLERMEKQGAIRIYRHYGSIGTTDVEWTDKEGQQHEAQLKFSSKKPYISVKECEELYDYAQQKKKQNILIWLIMKTAYKPEVWKRLN